MLYSEIFSYLSKDFESRTSPFMTAQENEMFLVHAMVTSDLGVSYTHDELCVLYQEWCCRVGKPTDTIPGFDVIEEIINSSKQATPRG